MLNSAFLPLASYRHRIPKTPLAFTAAEEGAVASISLPHAPAGGPHHSFHSVWQEQDDPVVTNPLGLAGADELVYYALRRVVEVAKLGLPAHQGIGTRHSEAKFKTWGPNK